MVEKAQYDAKRPVEVVDRPTSVEVFHLLSAALPTEALKADDSRGVTLTTINQAFVMERLQEVFGLVGYGWRYAFGPFWREAAEKGEEILVEVALQWRVTDDMEARYSPPVYWLKQWDPQTAALMEGWEFGPGPAIWSEPIFAKGGSSTNRRGNTRLTDAHRSAETSALSKAAARLGVGQEVYKDQDELSLAMNDDGQRNRRQGTSRQGRRQSGSTPRPTRAPKTGAGYPDMEAIQAAAQVHVGKLHVDATQVPQAKTLEQLATKMEALGIKMQPNKLVHALLGAGGFTQKGVIGVYNFLVEGQLNEANIMLINLMTSP